MDIYGHSPAGTFKKMNSYVAFIPNQLPPHIEWTSELVNSLSRADHMLGRLSQEKNTLQKLFIAHEAVLSSKIEGTRSTLEDILIHDVDATTRDGNDSPSQKLLRRNNHALARSATADEEDRQEVQNYIDALSHGMQQLNELPLSLRLIKEIHEILMRDVRGNYATSPTSLLRSYEGQAGEFRRSQNWIGAPGSTLMTAKFVPPTPEKLMPALGALELFLHDRTLPPLIHAGLCHYQFEAIHPFLDGNGRVGRLLIILLLIEQKVLSTPLLYISAFFEATRTDYYNGLYNVSAYGNWQEWLIYFLNGVALQSTDALSRIERINTLIQSWQTQAATTRSAYISQVIQRLAANPFVTAKGIAENTEIAFTTAQRIIQHLESLGIIVQRSEGERDRLYCATQILKILEEPTMVREKE